MRVGRDRGVVDIRDIREEVRDIFRPTTEEKGKREDKRTRSRPHGIAGRGRAVEERKEQEMAPSR